MSKRFYKHEGVNHPMLEAETDALFEVFKSDRRKAVIGDPLECIEALGLRRLNGVVFAYVGSTKDAYLGIEDPLSPTKFRLRHYPSPAKAAKVRDTFDQKGAAKTQVLKLKRPTKGRTLA